MVKKSFLFIAALALISLVAAQDGFGKEKNPVYEEYIKTYSSIAIKHMEEYKIPASITLAQAILESGAGTSELAKKANNHFGIKCHTDWTGATYHKDDDAVNECFRKYKKAEESFADHAAFLTTRQRYSSLFTLKITDYKGWAKGLKAAGYATNPSYAERLINLIEQYELYKFDTKEGQKQEKGEKSGRKKRGAPAVAEQQPPATPAGKVDWKRVTKVNGAECLTASEGESILSIAAQFEINPGALRRYNDLSAADDISAGDRVFIQSKRKKSSQPDHMVKSGETLHYISQLYGVKVKSLLKINGFDEGYEPPAGSVVKLN